MNTVVGSDANTGESVAATLVVLGSANRDYSVVVERHPLPGETVLGEAVSIGTGGKGANQAVAAAAAGARTTFLGAVGDDSVGADILADLLASGVDVSRVVRSQGATGIAMITVSHSGENSIVVAAGANSTLDAASTAALVTELAPTVLLAQLEIPVAVVSAAASALDVLGGRFVLNLSPSRFVSPKLLGLADPLIVNESEASELANFTIDGPADAETIAKRLLATSRSVVLTLGADGVVLATLDGVVHIPAERVPVVDTTGAGDAFAGALAAALASGSTLKDAVHAGSAAGAAAVQYVGAQPPRA
ncbi:MAG: ribokinase [Actinomycetota bacterium]|nr:ribokinase [Actinomycetota bacterium]MDQ1574249.1 ribokinase [Actinomycetota bacterium]